MNIAANGLSIAIGTFIAVINQCLSETTFTEDRYLYLGDLAAARKWLARISGGESATAVAAEILAPATAKQFGDGWRQGRWGDLERKAFSALAGEVRQMMNQTTLDTL